jgi:hypothetical protein
LLPLSLLFKFYGYIYFVIVLVLSCSMVTPPNMLFCLGVLQVTLIGHTSLLALDRPLQLHHVLLSLDIIKNLIFVRQFTTNNQVSIEFDPCMVFL